MAIVHETIRTARNSAVVFDEEISPDAEPARSWVAATSIVLNLLSVAAAVLLDATIVRAVLLPVVMALLGEANWYLPRGLRWLPQLSHGAPATAPPAVTVGAAAPAGHAAVPK